ncbi:MAG: alpha/beta hydrolase [Pseudomonadota bacterium]
MPPPLVCLPGALGIVEGGGHAFDLLAATRRVVPIAYRAGESLAELVERIADAAGPGRFDLLGQSAGGWLGQWLAAHAPERLRRLALSHSFVLGPGDAGRLRLARAVLLRLPRGLARPLLRARIARVMGPVAAVDPALHRRLLDAVAQLVRSDDFLAGLASQQGLLIESVTAPVPAAVCPMLIIESDDDPLVPARAPRLLRARYPGATVEAFAQTGHVSALVRPDAYTAAVARFLDAPD